mmetsp:Transcript_24310/g.43975  ORF Transcript_24310/g.43975 Transcript_24310/m.43975 type:complete len:92 (-) Transcript_24310:1615-1890(-)
MCVVAFVVVVFCFACAVCCVPSFKTVSTYFDIFVLSSAKLFSERKMMKEKRRASNGAHLAIILYPTWRSRMDLNPPTPNDHHNSDEDFGSK